MKFCLNRAKLIRDNYFRYMHPMENERDTKRYIVKEHCSRQTDRQKERKIAKWLHKIEKNRVARKYMKNSRNMLLNFMINAIQNIATLEHTVNGEHNPLTISMPT